MRRERDEAERQVTRLFDPEWYGTDGAWKKLDELCLEKDTGEYVEIGNILSVELTKSYVDTHMKYACLAKRDRNLIRVGLRSAWGMFASDTWYVLN